MIGYICIYIYIYIYIQLYIVLTPKPIYVVRHSLCSTPVTVGSISRLYAVAKGISNLYITLRQCERGSFMFGPRPAVASQVGLRRRTHVESVPVPRDAAPAAVTPIVKSERLRVRRRPAARRPRDGRGRILFNYPHNKRFKVNNVTNSLFLPQFPCIHQMRRDVCVSQSTVFARPYSCDVFVN